MSLIVYIKESDRFWMEKQKKIQESTEVLDGSTMNQVRKS